jgi:response regulator NasT
VDGDPAVLRFYQETLSALGHQVCVAGGGRQAVELCRALRPDLLVTEINLPDGDGLEAAAEAYKGRPLPVVVVSACHDPQAVGRVCGSPALAHLVKPVGPTALGPALAVALHVFERLRAAEEEAAGLKQALEDRKVVERAKGLLMKLAGVGEQEAFYRLQKLASDKNRKLVEAAQEVILVAGAFQPATPGPLAGPAADGHDGNGRHRPHVARPKAGRGLLVNPGAESA